MEKYKLLTFSEDYADEHNVPALECMTEEQYQKWLLTPSGTLNPDYEANKLLEEDYEKQWKDFWQHLTDKGYTIESGGRTFANTQEIPKDDLETLAYEKKVRALERIRNNYKVHSNMYANLGNSGDGFGESYSTYYLMEEFVEHNLVTVTDVDKSFYDTFHKANLNRLSLCNVFRIQE